LGAAGERAFWQVLNRSPLLMSHDLIPHDNVEPTAYSGDDFYCDVAFAGRASLQKIHESDNVLAFHHTKPYWPVHVVVVPKKHISSFLTLSPDDEKILLEMVEVIKTIAGTMEREHGAARIMTNFGKYQDTKHLHFHVSYGKPLKQ
jgi:histidine triad (HIT) family protein